MNASALIAWCKTKVGSGYVYGTVGETCTQAVLDRCRRMYGAMMGDTYYTGRCAKWLGKWVCDCSGLLKAARKHLDNVWADVSAQGTYDQCQRNRGVIRDMPARPGCYVFMYGKDGTGRQRMVHVGLYIGAGQVIEARGADYGIVITKLSERPWTHFGMASFVTFDVPADVQPQKPVIITGDAGDASTPKPDDAATKTIPYSAAVLAAHADGAVASPAYWEEVIAGRIQASGENIRKLLENYHRLLAVERD